MLKQWRPNFHPSRDIIDRAPVWIRLLDLPIEYWDREIILSIAVKVGKPIRVDEQCLQIDEGLYARVCVEIDLSCPWTPGVNVGDIEDLNFFFQPFCL